MKPALVFLSLLSFLLNSGVGLAMPEPEEGQGAGQSPLALQVQDPRFNALAESIAEEVRALRGSDQASTDAVLVVVGARPEDVPSVAVPPAAAVVWVDPIGWLHEPLSGALDADSRQRLVAREPLKDKVQADLEVFREILNETSFVRGSNAPEILVLVDPWLFPAGPVFKSVGRSMGLRIRIVDAGRGLALEDEGGEGAKSQRVVYLPPGLDMEIGPLAASLRAEKLPSFSARHGLKDVENGILAARLGSDERWLARRAALAVIGLAQGLPSPEATESGHRRLAMHLGTAEALGLEVPWRLKLSAKTFVDSQAGDSSSAVDALSVAQAREEAVAANLALRARSLATAASEQEIERALARLRPQLTLSSQVRNLDEDSAAAAFGAQPELLATLLGEASLILFSEDARAAVDIARLTQAARDLELRQLELDIALQAAVNLLGVARARAFEAIEKENLDLTYADLDAARSRRAVGSANRADVARLQARAARDRQAVVAAYGERRALEVALNRVLARPLDEEILPDIEPAALPLEDVVGKPDSFQALSRGVLARARELAPEMAAAREVVSARERALLAARRAFRLPTASAFARLETRFFDDGAGVEPPMLPFGGDGFPGAPDTNWSVGIGLSLPIATGGERGARQTEAEIRLGESQAVLARAEQQVEERARLALLGLETSYEAAFQARFAAKAAQEAFEVVEDGYLRGAENLTTLLDAQTELRIALLSRATASYAAHTRWLELQRASGGFFESDDQLLLGLTEIGMTSEEDGANEDSANP